MSNQGYGPNDPQYPGDHGGVYSGGTENLGRPGAPVGNQRGVLVGLGAVILAGLVVLILAVSGVFSPAESTTADGPKQVVQKLMQASVEQDLTKVKEVVCSRDLDNPQLADVVGEKHATSFQIGAVDQSGDSATVDVSITTPSDTDSSKIPVVREKGQWKVCLSDTEVDPSDTPILESPAPSLSIPSVPTPSISTSTSASPDTSCASSTDAASTARLFISYITLDQPDEAVGCVYRNRVTRAQLDALTGQQKVYSPTLPAGQRGPRFTVMSVTGGHTLSFTVQRLSGRYYVTQAGDT